MKRFRRYFKRIRKIVFLVRWKGVFRNLSYGAFIDKPILMTPEFIYLGRYVSLFKNCRVQGIDGYNTEVFFPEIIFNDYVSIQQNLHLTCAKKIEIGEWTAIAANVTITDIHHPYEDISLPIERQNIMVREVKIGKNCKIYNNAVILPGTSIGNHCTIGANSVVSGVYPDYCVIAGIPARIIKRFNPNLNKWQRTDRNGEFIND